jgi:recombinational DNA repair protein RecT
MSGQQPLMGLDAVYSVRGWIDPDGDPKGSGPYNFAQLERMCPRGVNMLSLVQGFLTYCEEQCRSPKASTRKGWSKVGFDSLWVALQECARIGLQPGAHGHVYIVPYGGVATVIPGYKGLIALMKRSGTVADVYANIVREGDEFEHREGSEPYIHHIRKLSTEAPAEIIAAYAIAIYANGARHPLLMDRWELNRVRTDTDAWRDWTDRMCRKSAIRQLANLIGTDEAVTHAFALLDRAEEVESTPQVQYEDAPAKGQRPAALQHAATYVETGEMSDEEKAQIKAAESAAQA